MKRSVQKEVKAIIKKHPSLNCTIKNFRDEMNWGFISQCQSLSEDFIREFQNEVDWYFISEDQVLSEDLIRGFKDKVNWDYISIFQIISEDFIREFKDKVHWRFISTHQTFSEDFIREFEDYVDWSNISACQTLSKDFIRTFKNRVEWCNVSAYQTLSEDFIREFKDRVVWHYISSHQKLSEDFIREFKDKVYWYSISQHQPVSQDFRKEFGLIKPNACWINYTKEQKLQYIKGYDLPYELDGDYLIAFKSVRSNYESVFKRGLKYETNKTYEAHCDCHIETRNSFGLAAWTTKKALEYHGKGKLLKVKIHLDDLGCFVYGNHKIRCKKFTVIEEVKIERNK